MPLSVVTASAVALGLLTPLMLASPASANQATVRYAIKNLLVVKAEANAGYERSKFQLWVDANGDCQDTRSEVLRQESKAAVTGSCSVSKGKWYSYYDKRTWTAASDVDIDHLVPLHEAWGSGARSWNADTRKRYANDLGDLRTLVAVTDNVNQSKGSQDPATWQPQYDKCRYLREWVAVKLRWKLTINPAEKTALLARASKCTNATLSWKPASIAKAGTSTGSISTGLRFTKIVYNPDGDERYAPNTEKVYVKNITASKKNLAKVALLDASGHRYTLPTYYLGAGQTVIVHSGSGKNGSGHLYAGWNTAVWNNDGDTARLMATNTTVIDRCSYAGGGTTAYC